MTRDQFISNMMGKSWSPNDPADILELQQFVLREEWWKEFYWSSFKKWKGPRYSSGYHLFAQWLFSDASRFADLVAEFKGYKEDKK
jgi:hypothetical protein